MQIEHTEFQDQLVRGLAHRMNNILTLFHGYLGLLMESQDLDKPTKEGLAKIKDGARQASELMDRTHSLVRPSTTVWRDVEVGEFVRLMRPGFESFRGPGTRIEMDIEDDLPHLRCDSGRIKTAITELVKNACEATAAGGTVRIEVRADMPVREPKPALQPVKWIGITVIDDGMGIPEELKGRILTPFFSTKKKQNAAGLGLTVAASFVQQHGGVLRFDAEPGKTTFKILLPSRLEGA